MSFCSTCCCTELAGNCSPPEAQSSFSDVCRMRVISFVVGTAPTFRNFPPSNALMSDDLPELNSPCSHAYARQTEEPRVLGLVMHSQWVALAELPVLVLP